MSKKKDTRVRRARKTRAKIRDLEVHRLCVFRTPRHIYAQIVDPSGSVVIASASTLSAAVRSSIKNGGNVQAAQEVGRLIAQNAKASGVDRVAFDRSGFRYHGRIKALADAAREHGLEF